MRVKLTSLAAALVCASGVLGAFSIAAPTASATGVKPAICKEYCDGSWGAKEHAQVFAEDHELYNVGIENCTENTQYEAQWVCWGYGQADGTGQEWHFHVWIGPYGREREWVWELY